MLMGAFILTYTFSVIGENAMHILFNLEEI